MRPGLGKKPLRQSPPPGSSDDLGYRIGRASRNSRATQRATPVIEIRRHIQTDWPIEQVAIYLCDFTTVAEWDPHTVRCSRVDSGPLRVGSEFDNVQRVGPVRSSSRYRVIDLRPGRSITLRSSTRAVEFTDTMTFDTAESGGTAVTYVAKVEFKGLAKAAESFLHTLLHKTGEDGAAGMSRVLGHLDASTHSIA